MAWAHIQTNATGVEATSTTIAHAYTSNVTAGSLLVGAVTYHNPTGVINISSVADSLGQTWTLAGSRVDTDISGFGGTWTIATYYYPNTLGGANTVTATLSVTTTGRSLGCSEYSGIATTGPLDKTTGQQQIDPGTAADAVTSGTTAATTQNNELVWAASLLPGSIASVCASGTGFTSRYGAVNTNFSALTIEDKNLVSAGATAGTFTAPNAADDTGTIVATFMETAGATYVGPIVAQCRTSMIGLRYV